MTPEHRSKQASQNANASRIKWQRQAIANGNLANERWVRIVERDTRIAELQARIENLSKMIGSHCDELTIYRRNIDRLNLACRQAESEADIWRTKAHDYEDADVQRQASAIAKGGAA